jgi:hypothetical protein
LRTSAVENDGIESHPIQETQAQCELIDLIKNCTTNFYDSKFGWLRGMRGRRENSEVSFYLALGTDGVQKTSYSFLYASSALSKEKTG